MNGQDCGCEKARKELEEYLHGELRSADAADIRAHLETCPSCSDEHTVGVTLSNALKGACKELAPETLRAQVLQKLREVQATHSA